MTIEEAIRILDPETTAEALAEIEYYCGFSGRTAAVQAVEDACILAVDALREQEQRENVWHDAKDNPPQKPGLYYGKKDDTDSMYLCQYRDGVWTMDAYPETRMRVIKWAYYNAFVQEQEERRWIPVTERLPEIGRKCLIANREIVVRGWLRPDGVWKTGVSSDEIWSKFSLFTPTHWMPLPEPPEEDV